MSATAANLVDYVMPNVPLRQWCAQISNSASSSAAHHAAGHRGAASEQAPAFRAGSLHAQRTLEQVDAKGREKRAQLGFAVDQIGLDAPNKGEGVLPASVRDGRSRAP